MDTPKTPRHPSNGYEIANGTPLPAAAPANTSPQARTSLSSLPQCTAFSPYASPSIRSDGRRRSLRLEMRSPGKHLDLKLGSVEEEMVGDYHQPRRRCSLRLQRQASPLKSDSPKVVKVSSGKKSNKKRRQSAHFGFAKNPADAREKESQSIKVEARDLLHDNVLEELDSPKAVQASKKSKKERRKSKCFGVANSPMDDTEDVYSQTSCLDLVPTVSAEENLTVCLVQNAEKELVLAFDNVASTMLKTIMEEHELDLDEMKADEGVDMLNDSFDTDKENMPTLSAIKRKKGRRDTFDLSRKRGLRVGPSVLEAACTPGSNSKHFKDVHEIKPVNCSSITIDTSFDGQGIETADELNKKLFVTPKNSEFNIDVAAELSRTLKDDPHNNEVVVAINAEVRARMEELSSVDVEKKMKTLFGDFKVYNYPCVSARIFSAMSIIYTKSNEFSHILPLLTSLVNAEIVSLKNRDENRDVYFINKRVCFSGYDYSSTMPAVDSIDGSHIDLVSSIEALKMVLEEAQHLSRHVHHVDTAINCLEGMISCGNVSDVCSKTLVGYFPSSRFLKAIKHYSNELKDIKCYLTGQESSTIEHVGVRFRLGDFIGRSIRFHLRKMLNSLPESIVDFFVEGCEERWGRAVDDRSISSILNFSLEKVSQFMAASPNMFDDDETIPFFFTKDASEAAMSVGKMQDVRVRASLKNASNDALKDIAADMEEARRFLLGARACKFVWELLCWPGVKQHIRAQGGWDSIESIAIVFYDLQLDKNSDHQHFTLLRDVDQLTQMLSKAVERFEESINECEAAIRKLGRQMSARQRDHAYRTKGTAMFALRMSLKAEEGERFPVPIANYNC